MSNFLTNLLGGSETGLINKGNDLISGIKNQGNANRVVTGGLQSFLSQLAASNGLYRGVFYEVYISDPNNSTGGKDRIMNLLCHSASIPGFRLDTISNTIYSLPYEVPVGIVFDPAWFTFYMDNTFSVNSALWDMTFKNNIRMNNTNWSPSYRDDNTLLTVEIFVFNPDVSQNTNRASTATWDGLPLIASYQLTNAFFKTVQQTPVSWEAHDNISSVTVELSYEWMVPTFYSAANSGVTSLPPAAQAPLNFDTIMTKFPALGVAYDAARRSVLQNQSILANPIANELSQFLP